MKLPRLGGLPIAIAGVLLLSPDSLVIRLVSADRLIVLFWRGLMMAIGFATVAGLSRGSRPAGQGFQCGRPALVAGLLLGAANVAFVFSITSCWREPTYWLSWLATALQAGAARITRRSRAAPQQALSRPMGLRSYGLLDRAVFGPSGVDPIKRWAVRPSVVRVMDVEAPDESGSAGNRLYGKA